jgi:hypothetical protein
LAPQAKYPSPSTVPDSATANTTSTWQDKEPRRAFLVPNNAFSGNPGGTSGWQTTGAPGSTGNLTLAVDFGAAEVCRR